MYGLAAGNGKGVGYISSVMADCEDGYSFFALWDK